MNLTTVLDLLSFSKWNHCSLALIQKHGNTQAHSPSYLISFQQKCAFCVEFKNCKWLQWKAAASLYKWLTLRNF